MQCIKTRENLGIKTQNPSITNCLKQIEEQATITKEKSGLPLTTSVREYQEFNNTNSAIQYLDKWGFVNKDVCDNPMVSKCYINPLNLMAFPELYSKGDASNGFIPKINQYNDIVIVLVRFETTVNQNDVKILQPIICINGNLQEESKNKITVTGSIV